LTIYYFVDKINKVAESLYVKSLLHTFSTENIENEIEKLQEDKTSDCFALAKSLYVKSLFAYFFYRKSKPQ
jgi:hypothetical protein